ncbi:hypothetical protein Taro_037216 [Colocasia esculenta]|uniref:Domain X domain-containing protein n=1 Tax=Colocasia esculenta TaxID=4460 RepID=A0A843W933_COLES|nr:hypothetical protein [Colocasia esculenta]
MQTTLLSKRTAPLPGQGAGGQKRLKPRRGFTRRPHRARLCAVRRIHDADMLFSSLARTSPRRHLPFSSAGVSFFLLRSLSSSPVPTLDGCCCTTRSPISQADLEALVLRQYRRGKFRGLLRSVVSRPSVLLAACRNLASSSDGGHEGQDGWNNMAFSPEWVARCGISVEHLSRELVEGRLDLQACCVKMVPSRKKGVSLVLPNLKLKAVMEAVRMALEVVYDRRFATFAYGGRVGMGRHTAIRYLKSAVQNPTWWFRVALFRERFGPRHVRRLFAVIEEKIEDPDLFGLVKGLFASEALMIELGGLDMGRGFPQESGLCSILVNIYFSGLDCVIQDLRLQVQKENPLIQSEDGPRVLHNPVRVYAVRHLDEILVISSGSKAFLMDVKEKATRYIEDNLELKVDKLMTSIHSAVSEKMDFMGMELQAVPPSVLHPPMSEKAIRARKKYLKQKAAKSLELKNARETVRKKLGIKILNHVFKKLKRCGGFKSEFPIESEVRVIFESWAEEVVKDFFQSREECWIWHRALTSGDFLNLKGVRDQLPTGLIDAYDEFQRKVHEYMIPVKAKKFAEDVDVKEGVHAGTEVDDNEEAEGKKYSERTVKDLTELCIRVKAPIELVRKAVKMAGFTNNMGRPRPIKLLISLEDTDIINWYAGVGKRWLEFFCCCRNFRMVKTVVNYHLRFSCFLTLAEKHESTKYETIKHYTKDLKITNKDGVEEAYFPTEREIKMMGDSNLSDPMPVDGALCLLLVRCFFFNSLDEDWGTPADQAIIRLTIVDIFLASWVPKVACKPGDQNFGKSVLERSIGSGVSLFDNCHTQGSRTQGSVPDRPPQNRLDRLIRADPG